VSAVGGIRQPMSEQREGKAVCSWRLSNVGSRGQNTTSKAKDLGGGDRILVVGAEWECRSGGEGTERLSGRKRKLNAGQGYPGFEPAKTGEFDPISGNIGRKK